MGGFQKTTTQQVCSSAAQQSGPLSPSCHHHSKQHFILIYDHVALIEVE
jgi:hypothetical protein